MAKKKIVLDEEFEAAVKYLDDEHVSAVFSDDVQKLVADIFSYAETGEGLESFIAAANALKRKAGAFSGDIASRFKILAAYAEQKSAEAAKAVAEPTKKKAKKEDEAPVAKGEEGSDAEVAHAETGAVEGKADAEEPEAGDGSDASSAVPTLTLKPGGRRKRRKLTNKEKLTALGGIVVVLALSAVVAITSFFYAHSASLDKKLRDANSKIVLLVNGNEQAQKDNDALRKQNEAQGGQISSLGSRNQELADKNSDLEDENARLFEENDRLNAEANGTGVTATDDGALQLMYVTTETDPATGIVTKTTHYADGTTLIASYDQDGELVSDPMSGAVDADDVDVDGGAGGFNADSTYGRGR